MNSFPCSKNAYTMSIQYWVSSVSATMTQWKTFFNNRYLWDEAELRMPFRHDFSTFFLSVRDILKSVWARVIRTVWRYPIHIALCECTFLSLAANRYVPMYRETSPCFVPISKSIIEIYRIQYSHQRPRTAHSEAKRGPNSISYALESCC